MKRQLTLLMLSILSTATHAVGQAAKIEGYVSNDKGVRVAGVQIIVTPGGQTGRTDSQGHFIINLPNDVLPGQAAQIRVDRVGWVIFNPMFGRCETKSAARNYEPLAVVIVPKSSPLALSPNRLSSVITKWAAERVKLRTQVGQLKRELDEYAFLREYATEYGFTLEEFRAAAEQWAQIKDSDDKEERALKEYWQQNYDRAAQLAEESAQAADEELRQAKQRTAEASVKVIRRYGLAGGAFYADYKFSEALTAYSEIEQRFERGKISKEDFTEGWAEVKLLIGIVKNELGTRVEGPAVPRLLLESMAAYRQAETFYTRAQFPQQWAMIQNNIGNVCINLGERTEGKKTSHYMNEAVVAYRAALEVFTQAQSPQQWATTQSNLGVVLHLLGKVTEGADYIKYFKEGIAAYHAALEVRTRTQFPQDWAETQNNLGNVFISLGERAEGSERLKHYNDAVTAYRAALEIFSRAQSAQHWAIAQTNLGNALSHLAWLSEGSTGIRYSNEAVAAYRAALEVRTRAQLPQQWAETQNNLGNEFFILGVRAEGSERLKYFNDAVAAFRGTLEVFTRAQFPQRWAVTQNNLSKAYFWLSDWAGAAEASANVLQVYPDSAEAYSRAAVIHHEKLFKFEQAFALHQQWLARHTDDVAGRTAFAEAHLTTARFSECRRLIPTLLAQPGISDTHKTVLRTIEIVSLLALNETKQVPANLDTLIADIARQPLTFKVEWSFDGTRHFISHNEQLAASRVLLAQLLDALASKDRDSMLNALQEVRMTFK